MMKAIINNFTSNEIQAEIKPSKASGINTDTKITLLSKDKKHFQHEEVQYNVNITKVNSNPVNMLFSLKFSSYMAFMSDLETDRIYIQNFLNGNKYNDKHSNIPDEIYSQSSTLNQINEDKILRTQNISNDPNIHFQTTTNIDGRKSSTIEFDVNKKEITAGEQNLNNKGSYLNNLKNGKNKEYVVKDFLAFDDDDEHDFFSSKFLKKKTDNNFSFGNMLKKNNSIKPELLEKIIKESDDTKKRDVIPGEILITNSSRSPVFIRLSGGEEKDIFAKITCDSFRFFKRKNLSIYRMMVCSSEKTKGPVYNVKSGCEYDFDKSGNLTSPFGEHLLSILHSYDPEFELEHAYGILDDKEDNSARKLPLEKTIIIANKSDKSVNVKVQGSSMKEHESSIQIEPFVYVKFHRIGFSFKLTLTKNNGKNFKHNVEVGKCYEITGENQDLIDTNQGKQAPKIFTTNLPSIGGSLLKLAKPKTLERENYINDDIWGPKWQDFRKLITSHPNKDRLKDFNNLCLRFISIKNNSKATYYVRVIIRNIGSQDFVCLEPGQTYDWKRTNGEFLTEIVHFDNLESKRFKLKSDEKYFIENESKVINQETKENIPNILEYFEDTENLVYFDKNEKKYVTKKIHYKNFNKLTSKILKINPEEEKLEYFNGLKPNYIPGQTYTDADFPPDETSLRAVDKDGNKRPKHFVHAKSGLAESQIKTLTFKRPKECFEGQYYLYKDDISIEDVKQGQIGNCYLISVLASLSQRPDLIFNVFKSRTVNPDGYYELYFYENSEKKIMFIDDYLVAFNSKYITEFQFAKPNGEELWVMLLEKAYAKFEGGYSNIIGGKMYQELNWLTGAIARQVKTDNPSAWNEIYTGINHNYIITTSSNRGSGNHFNKTPNGIANGHAYSIIGANEFTSDSGDIRLLRMRNPWGHTEWKGDFSDDDAKNWTPELKEYFEYDKFMGDDGIFFMPFDDYIQEFSSFVICCIDAGKK